MADLSKESRDILRAKIETFRALHQAHLYFKEIQRLQIKHGELNVFLQERKTDGWGKHVIDVAMHHIQEQENEINRLRAALEYYAAEETYENLMNNEASIGFDEGETAREALRGDTQ